MATSQVLSKESHDSFQKAFGHIMKDESDVILPTTVYEVNSAPFQRKDKVNLASEFLKGKDTLNASLKHIKQMITEEIGEVQKEMKMGHEVLQAQLTAVTNSIDADWVSPTTPGVMCEHPESHLGSVCGDGSQLEH